ncbi:proline oxidase [Aureobasidium pullulans]|nr:proline oxidase [Aureobasidium pullulans]
MRVTKEPPPVASGLSALPNKMLGRSLLIATISSKSYLLIPCLKLLSFLSKPGRSRLLSVDKNPLIHAILRKTFYDQFCAGETRKDTVSTIKGLKDMGFRGVIMTFAKETVFDHRTKTEHGVGEALLINKEKGLLVESVNTQNADIDTWRKGTLETIDLPEGTDYLAVKLTGAGPTVTAAFADQKPLPKQMTDALDEIATKCQQRDVRILVDAESQRFQWGILDTTLNLMRKFNRSDRALIYNTYQAYLKSTASTIHKHMETASKENFTLGLKLVRGAYINSDERSLIHDTKEDTDSAYNTIALGALKQEIGKYGGDGLPFPKVNLFLASHNKPSVLAAHALHQSRIQVGLPTVPVGFGQLQGMSDEVSFGLLALKQKDGQTPEVYKCSTWGSMSECLAYLLRRAVENRDAVSRTGDELNALRSEAWRRMKGMFISP